MREREREKVEWSGDNGVRWRNVAREVRKFGEKVDEKGEREWDERG